MELLVHLFDWVCSVSIMAGILVVLILTLQLVLKKRLKPRWLYLMWLLVMLRLMMPWGPQSEFSIYNWIGYSTPAHTAGPIYQDVLAQRGQAAAAPSVYHHLFVVIWVVGAGLLALYTIWVNWTFSRKLNRETAAVTDERVLELFHQCKALMNVRTAIELVQSSRLGTPALSGFLKPVVIIPRHMAACLSDEQLRHIFLHELAHSKRNDIQVNGLMYVLLIIHWFNPLLWFAYRRMRDDQEIASDALALSCLAPDSRQEYGYTLITLLEGLSQPAKVTCNVNLIGNKDQLQRRMRMIKQFKSKSYRWSFLGLALIIIISGCTLTNPKDNANSVPLAGSSATESKVESTDKPASLEADTSKLGAAGDQQQNGASDVSKQTASAGDQPASPSPSPQAQLTDARTEAAKPTPAAAASEQASARRQAAEQSTRAAAQDAPRAVPATDRRSAPAAAPVASEVAPAAASAPEQQRSVPAAGTRAVSAEQQPQPVPATEVRR